ncbi:unnamed protein product, partial [Gongylonema pulchrum]|uniref:Flavodoxin-like domain-containing protein n=1 Tax=Gongylonema pulchrum TaxID=637853 RepID=A0A183DJ78_9BILA
MCHSEVVKGSRARVVLLFGEQRNEGNLQTAENIAKAWKALYNPLVACGERSYALIGPLAELDLALIKYVSGVVEKSGFRPVVVPDIIHQNIPEACGLQQRSDKNILYRLNEH